MINRIFKAKFLPDLLRFFPGKSGETLDFWQEKLENDIGDASADTLLVSKAGRCSWEVKADRQAGRLSCSLTSQLSFCRSKKPVFRRIASLEETPELLLSIAWIWLTNYLCCCRSIANCNCNGALRAPAPSWDFNFLDTVLWYINGVNDKCFYSSI